MQTLSLSILATGLAVANRLRQGLFGMPMQNSVRRPWSPSCELLAEIQQRSWLTENTRNDGVFSVKNDTGFPPKACGNDEVIGFHGESVELAVANEDAMQSPCACPGGCSQAPD
ncbi:MULTISPECIES: hypothetical protein [unclassified Undibacterium]|uniref:hypothetical protein n=1 Tax=unclassified Undibacterium TaxID=2630295 RepID=UPI002AC89E09|nr:MULTISPECIES: hypothetical protein [unclassified Undibacterium]MEB0139745.1 hypothetical protein [Undibacterium sp. CCC2.1]MEB0172626.1 hypothetical protein [Undibacterium sp. CCC1.1]MEB0176393.1 hypothetical protein [Undibacterium sp. CCC3.4]MEB0215749.1 hypothetical protein [Undibacterium sp. 5I2]WPX45170.1 hypothetical protein RHM61_08110 [Undibacterium sp. CCC3.4]